MAQKFDAQAFKINQEEEIWIQSDNDCKVVLFLSKGSLKILEERALLKDIDSVAKQDVQMNLKTSFENENEKSEKRSCIVLKFKDQNKPKWMIYVEKAEIAKLIIKKINKVIKNIEK